MANEGYHEPVAELSDEEKEHAAMLMEWVRRNDPVLDKELRDWLFTDKTFDHD